ncbi:hypothetical protein FHT44_005017 [Mycolicibacterium sp. BK634]|uniref:hypothetical protein n=1 Tax=Mycolicibacterium sp. BK634 TaxID=2587099 RepID=UPI0017EFED78|nr:hypothetical protein [Mycolicibacterium sp. BK634]MBB3752505.1 hypothetical protein [Mycolicibacterium sp. BK634]
MITEKVRHVSKPSEPWGKSSDYGRITRTAEDGPLRVTPAARGIPAQAHVLWNADSDNPYYTWERLADLKEVGRR